MSEMHEATSSQRAVPSFGGMYPVAEQTPNLPGSRRCGIDQKHGNANLIRS
jgi:hypothetical protein